MSQTTYRNRRGRRVSIGDAIDTISEDNSKKIDSIDQLKPKLMKQPKSERPKRVWRLRLPRLRRRQWALIGLTMILLIALFAVMTVILKQDFEKQASSMRAQILEISKSGAERKMAGSEAAEVLNERLTHEYNCQIDLLSGVKWYGPAQSAQSSCQQVAIVYAKLKSNLSDIENESRYVEQVAEILSDPLTAPEDVPFASVGDYEARWHQATEGLGTVSVPDSMREVHENLNARVISIATEWKNLAQATADQNSQLFIESERELEKSYQHLRALRNEIIEPINQRQQTINQLVSKLIAE